MEYMEKFENLIFRCGVSEPEEQSRACYLKELKFNIYDKV